MADAIDHLGYVQIDTINVIERSHHYIPFTRIPAYRRSDLRQAQSTDKFGPRQGAEHSLRRGAGPDQDRRDECRA